MKTVCFSAVLNDVWSEFLGERNGKYRENCGLFEEDVSAGCGYCLRLVCRRNSDFDALIIAGKEKAHDSSIVDGVVLDVFVYPAETFSADYDPEEFVQVWDGKIVLDEHGIAGQLKAKVLDYIEHLPKKTATEVAQEVEWPKKTLRLMEKSDAEAFGLYAKALREFDRESLSAWIDYLKSMVNIRPDGTLTR